MDIMTEDKIEIAAEQNYAKHLPLQSISDRYKGFIEGALSPETKEYWQQDMYSEEEVIALCSELHVDHLHSNFWDWFNKNKKK